MSTNGKASDGERKIPTDWAEVFPGRFLKEGMLKGKHVTLTVAEVYVEQIEGETAGIMAFKERDIEFGINKTNSILLAAMFGRDPRNLKGKRITLMPDTCHYQKDPNYPCIRVAGSPDMERDTIEVEVVLRKKIGKRVVTTKETRTLRKTG
jgi:hypothetical protein